MKNKPTRKCLATQTILPKEEMFRVVRTTTGEIILDMTGKANGRGAYISKDLAAIEKARKSKCLNKALEVEVPEAIYDRMITFLNMK